jgi:sterol desaturase/sphingolipid hydroxylase (fatty acid hydroxylase superfamily)
MDRLIETLRAALRLLPQDDPWRGLSREAVFIVAIGCAVILLERFYRRDLTRYRSRHFLNDLAYSFFYQGGLYTLLIYVPIFGYLQKQMAFADMHVLSSLPPAAAFVCFWLITDFIGYWLHRMQHTVPFFWAFHSIHHVPTRITYLTSNRNHVIDQLMANVIVFIPILILGVPKTVWVPFLLLHSALESLQHAALSWKFGPLYRVVVSPMFHNLHHSTHPDEYNGNYSKILSIWDFVFGTAVDRDELPAAYGVEGMDVPESLTAQFLWPFRVLSRRRQPEVVVPANVESA